MSKMQQILNDMPSLAITIIWSASGGGGWGGVGFGVFGGVWGIGDGGGGGGGGSLKFWANVQSVLHKIVFEFF